jgi:hypothetical protein
MPSNFAASPGPPGRSAVNGLDMLTDYAGKGSHLSHNPRCDVQIRDGLETVMKNTLDRRQFLKLTAATFLTQRLSSALADPVVRPRRFAENPIIRPDMLPGQDGANINGPSLIRVPEWIAKPLGNYYLYFAHHGGKYIRLACADRIEGPWRIHQPGTLKLSQATGCTGHIASPDAIVDEQRKQIRLYFHGPAKGGQKSFLALSGDGLNFTADSQVLGEFYFRVIHYRDAWYAMSKGGLMYRSADGLKDFQPGPNPLPASESRKPPFNDGGPRHVALRLIGDSLDVYYTSIGDAPERIFRCRVPLQGDWLTWRASQPEEILRPEMEYEGANLPLKKSVAGAVRGRENALRDPAVFSENGRVYLLYSVAGESGIAIAELQA